MHKVTRPDDPEKSCLPCRCNPMMLVCTCKGSRKTGICSHIIAVNHRCGMINIQSELMHMQKKRKPGKGRVRQATGRRQMQPASSSDERLLKSSLTWRITSRILTWTTQWITRRSGKYDADSDSAKVEEDESQGCDLAVQQRSLQCKPRTKDGTMNHREPVSRRQPCMRCGAVRRQ